MKGTKVLSLYLPIYGLDQPCHLGARSPKSERCFLTISDVRHVPPATALILRQGISVGKYDSASLPYRTEHSKLFLYSFICCVVPPTWIVVARLSLA
jgi:hypothetical protein